jgi:hypothetical protein
MAVLGVAAVGIHFGVALTAGSQVQTARYALAFVCGMS